MGSTNKNGQVAYHSNFGATTVDVFAPGEDIYSTDKYSGYDSFTGTSMAAPYVTGVAALIKSLHPNMTGAELKTALKNSVDIKSYLIGKCTSGGIINAYKAVNYIPIAGSVDIKFKGTGIYTTQGEEVGEILLAKFHVFTNGQNIFAERGKVIYPIPGYVMDDSYLECGPVPAGISAYINQSGLGTITTPGEFHVPSYGPSWSGPHLNYSYLPVNIDVTSSAANIYYNNRQYYPRDSIAPNDRRRIFVW